MTDYTYSKVAVYAELGGALRLARNSRTFVTDTVTGLPVNVTQGAFTAPYLYTDSSGIADFTATTPGPIRLTTGATFVDVFSEELPSLGLAAATSSAASASSAAASAADAALSAALVGAPADSAVAAIVGNPASATRVSLSSTYASSAVVAGTGIDPTGATFSTAAIQAKLDAAGVGSHVHFPLGTYKVATASTDTTTIERACLYFTSAHSGMTVTCDPGTIIKGVNDGSNLWFNLVKITDCVGLTFDGITFDANAQAAFASDPTVASNGLSCIYPKSSAVDRGCRDLTFKDCKFLNSFNAAFQTHGAYGQTGPFYYAADIKITGCHFENTGAHGIALNYAKNVIIAGNTFYNLGRKPILSTGIGSGVFCDVSTANLNVVIQGNVGENPGYGFTKVEFHTGDPITNKHITIADNKVTSTETITGEAFASIYGIRVNGIDVTVRGNTFDGYRGRGIDMTGSQAANCNILDNTLTMQAGAPSVYPAIDASGNPGGHEISGNRLTGQTGVGINVSGLTSTLIQRNRIIGSGSTGLKITAGTQTRVSVNLIQDSVGVGLYVTSTADFVTLDGNDIFDSRTAGARTQTIGILVDSAVTNMEIRRNRSRNNSSQQTNIFGTLTSEIIDGNKIIYGTAAPTTGAWLVGDLAINTAPAAGGYERWRCTTAGSPGTWKGAGLIQA